jgi:hypothetical protein
MISYQRNAEERINDKSSRNRHMAAHTERIRCSNEHFLYNLRTLPLRFAEEFPEACLVLYKDLAVRFSVLSKALLNLVKIFNNINDSCNVLVWSTQPDKHSSRMRVYVAHLSYLMIFFFVIHLIDTHSIYSQNPTLVLIL